MGTRMTYEDAIILAVKAHHGQTRWGGEPYVLHPLRVANRLGVLYADETLKKAAVLHDVLEDTETTYRELLEWFGIEVADTVQLVSRPDDRTYMEFIGDIVASDSWRAIRLKLADIEDNLSDLPEDHGLRKRYERARSALTAALEGMG